MLKPSKCFFAQVSVEILGHVVSREGIKADQKKLKAIHDFPVPKKSKDVQSFLGLANYYRKFIDGFATIAKPLYALTKKNIKKFEFSDEARAAFNNLKTRFISPPVLRHFDPRAPIELRTDASTDGIGAVLLQEFEGAWHPIAFVSRSLTKCERVYPITELECLAVVYAIDKLRPYLWSMHFRVVTDHSALCYLKTAKALTGRLARWAIKLQEYDFDIKYKRGVNHRDADCLSRYPVDQGSKRDEDESLEVPTFLLETSELAKLQYEDAELAEIMNALRDPEYGNIGLQKRAKNFELINQVLHKINVSNTGELKLLVIPKSLYQEILFNNHSDPMSAHLGFQKTYDRIATRYYWSTLRKDVERYVKGCTACQTRKVGKLCKPAGLLQPLPIGEIGSMWSSDVLGPFPRTKLGNRYVIVASEYVSRYVEAAATPDAKAETVGTFLRARILSKHGPPKKLLTDRGKAYQAEIVKEMLKGYGTSSVYTTSYHPQCNGLTERFNKTLCEMLSQYVNSKQDDWDVLLDHVVYGYNSAVHKTTKYTPFELFYGRRPVTPCERQLTGNIREINNIKSTEELDKMRNIAKTRIEEAQKSEKARVDKKRRDVSYNIGDKVLLFVPSRRVGRSPKLEHRFHGPYKISNKLSEVNYEIDKGNGRKDIVHVERLKLYHENWTPPTPGTPRTTGEVGEQKQSGNTKYNLRKRKDKNTKDK